MTYCVGIQVDEGLVLASDTRTSASFDDVRTYAKTHRFVFPGERCLVLMSAGNLGTTQAVLSRLQRDLDEGAAINLRRPGRLFEIAEYIGGLLVAAQAQVNRGGRLPAVNVEATMILAGQIAGEPPGLLLIYPLGNVIAASPETPYLQIGESKYGKPILDRIIRSSTSLDDAARCALVSLDSTIRSNVSVGLPIDLSLIRRDALELAESCRLEEHSPLYQAIRDSWAEQLNTAMGRLPRWPWEPPSAGAIRHQQAAQQQQ